VSLGRDRRETNESASFTCDSDMRSEGFSWSRAPTVVSRRMQVAACVKGAFHDTDIPVSMSMSVSCYAALTGIIDTHTHTRAVY